MRPDAPVSKMTGESRRFLVYQLPLIKGICILGVILIHVTAAFTEMTHSGGLFFTLLFLNSLARFAVPLFVAFSGFYLSLNARNENAVPFYRRTLRFLLVPYILYSVLYSIWDIRSGGDPWRLVKDLPWASASYHLWFGLLVLQLYILHPFLRRRYLACGNRGALVVGAFLLQIGWSVLSITLLPLVWSALSTSLFPDSTNAAAAVRTGAKRIAELIFMNHIGNFLGGYLILERSEEMSRFLKRRTSAIPGSVVWVAAAAGLAAYWGVPLSRGTPWDAIERRYLLHFILTPLVSLAALATILPLAQNPRRIQMYFHRWLHSFGLYSYGIYYLHPFVALILSRGFHHFVGPDPVNMVSFHVMRFAVVSFVTLLAVKAMARLPFGRYVT